MIDSFSSIFSIGKSSKYWYLLYCDIPFCVIDLIILFLVFIYSGNISP